MVGTGNSQFSGQVVLRGHSAECLLNILATGPTLFPQGYRKSRFQHRTQSTRHQCAPLSSYNLESRIGKGGSSSPTRGKSISVQSVAETLFHHFNPTFLRFFGENLKFGLLRRRGPKSGLLGLKFGSDEPSRCLLWKRRFPGVGFARWRGSSRARAQKPEPEAAGTRAERGCAVSWPLPSAGAIFSGASHPPTPFPGRRRGSLQLAAAARASSAPPPRLPRRRWLLVASTRAGPETEHVWKRSAAPAAAAARAEPGCVRLSPFSARPQERSASAAPPGPAERGALAAAGPAAAHRSPLLATRKPLLLRWALPLLPVPGNPRGFALGVRGALCCPCR
ncbi:uncharacterized protein [Castor canadensis]|uniref:Uncharacterized protein n=1 Tax=Castor canadensis TaxID=51338 RepID=A0AC58M111_CASCN